VITVMTAYVLAEASSPPTLAAPDSVDLRFRYTYPDERILTKQFQLV